MVSGAYDALLRRRRNTSFFELLCLDLEMFPYETSNSWVLRNDFVSYCSVFVFRFISCHRPCNRYIINVWLCNMRNFLVAICTLMSTTRVGPRRSWRNRSRATACAIPPAGRVGMVQAEARPEWLPAPAQALQCSPSLARCPRTLRAGRTSELI